MLECACHVGYTGLCYSQSCPLSTSDVEQGGLPCSAHNGYGVCHKDLRTAEQINADQLATGRFNVTVQQFQNRPVYPITQIELSPIDGYPLVRALVGSSATDAVNTTYTGRCACIDGYFDEAGSCSKQLCPSATGIGVCGHGKCIGNTSCLVIPDVYTGTWSVASYKFLACSAVAFPSHPGLCVSNYYNRYSQSLSGNPYDWVCTESYFSGYSPSSFCIPDCNLIAPARSTYDSCGTIYGRSSYTIYEYERSAYWTNLLIDRYCMDQRCVCDEGFEIDPLTGVCTIRACPLVNGVACNGLTVASGWGTPSRPVGSNICLKGPEGYYCPCHHAVPKSIKPKEMSLLTSYYNDAEHDNCVLSYRDVCGGIGSNLEIPCNGVGFCYPAVCGNGESWDACGTDMTLIDSKPVCSCQATATGTKCETSRCGGASPLAPCSLNNTGLTTTGSCVLVGSSYQCRCGRNSITGVPYIGANCETAATGCETPLDVISTISLTNEGVYLGNGYRADVCSGNNLVVPSRCEQTC